MDLKGFKDLKCLLLKGLKELKRLKGFNGLKKPRKRKGNESLKGS